MRRNLLRVRTGLRRFRALTGPAGGLLVGTVAALLLAASTCAPQATARSGPPAAVATAPGGGP